MKKVYSILICAAVLASFANCGKNDDQKRGAPADMSAQCYQMQMASGAYNGQNVGQCSYPYASASYAGFGPANIVGGGFGSTYGSMYGATNPYVYGGAGMGMSACNAGMAQAYSPSKGLGCVETRNISASGQPVIYGLSGTNFTTVSQFNPTYAAQAQYGQYGQMNPYGQYNPYNPYTSGWGTTNSMLIPQSQSQLYRVCDNAEPCPGNQTCRNPLGPMVGQAPIGICYFN